MPRLPLVLPLAAMTAVAAALVIPAAATPPGDNGRIVFERPTPNGPNMFTVEADGSDLTRLTGLRGGEGDASWSGDGTKVAFVRATDPDGPYEIWVVNADGSGVERLTRHRGFSIAPAWSPDGRKIVYATDAGGQDHLRLYVMNADGSGKQRITNNRRNDYTDPSWSSNGRRIASAILQPADNPREFDSSLASVDADGGSFRRLSAAGGPDELNPNWSPDSREIAYERNGRFPVRQSDLALMNANGSAKHRITRTGVHETNPSFAADGTRIAFTSDRDRRGLSTERLGRGFEVYTMAVDGGDIVRVTNNRRADLFPDWQPVR
jgi:TolB protein